MPDYPIFGAMITKMTALQAQFVLVQWRNIAISERLFVGSENRSALMAQFQLFAVASGDRFLGNTKEAQGSRPRQCIMKERPD
jgi:hypothetical protein